MDFLFAVLALVILGLAFLAVMLLHKHGLESCLRAASIRLWAAADALEHYRDRREAYAARYLEET